MASIEQRIEHLFPPKRGKGPTSIAMVATIFAERRGQWLTQDDLIDIVNKKFGKSTIRKAFRKLSLPMDDLNGHSFIDTEFVKNVNNVGGPILRGRLSDAAIQKIFQLVTPVNQEPPSYFIKQKSLLAQLTRLNDGFLNEFPPLKIGDRYLSPEDIIELRNEKCGEENTRALLKKMAKDKPGADKATMEQVITKMSKDQGIEFDAVTAQFYKDGKVIFPDGNLAKAYYKWKHELHGKDEPYTEKTGLFKGHHYGRFPKQPYSKFTDLAMLKLATDENRHAFSVSTSIVDFHQDCERVHAMEEMANKGKEEAIEELIRVLSSDDSRYARQEAARSLGHLHDPRIIEPLIKAMLEDGYIAVRSIAAEGLANFGYRLEFTQALNDSDPHIRRTIAEILGRIGDLNTVDSLIEALDDPDVGVRCSSANSLGEIGDSSAAYALISKLECENESVRHAAAVALGNIGDPRAVEPLLKICDDPSSWVQCSAIYSLGDIGDSRAVDTLISKLESENEDVRCAAAVALGNIGDPRATEPLKKICDDPSTRVHDALMDALQKLERRG